MQEQSITIRDLFIPKNTKQQYFLKIYNIVYLFTKEEIPKGLGGNMKIPTKGIVHLAVS